MVSKALALSNNETFSFLLCCTKCNVTEITNQSVIGCSVFVPTSEIYIFVTNSLVDNRYFERSKKA